MANRTGFVTLGFAIGLLLGILPESKALLQCFKDKPHKHYKRHVISTVDAASTVDTCVFECQRILFRYAAISSGKFCSCFNQIEGVETQTSDCNLPCNKKPSQICGGNENITLAVYETGIQVPGPVTNLQVNNVTETRLALQWSPPEFAINIINYIIKVQVLRTYASFSLTPVQLKVSNDTLHLNVDNLHPGTTYNITIQASCNDGLGYSSFVEVETLIGEPDPSPNRPMITLLDGKQMAVHIEPAINDNGPVSAYRVVVINEVLHQGYMPELLTDYEQAMRDALGYYIAAELKPKDIGRDFIIGDGKNYNGFYNAPIPEDVQVDITLGIVSKKGERTRIRYAEPSNEKIGVIVLKVGDTNYESESLNTSLSIAIGIFAVLLLLSIGVFIFLKYRLRVQRRRAPECQELTLQGPIVEMENSGYIPEEELPQMNHYDKLKEKVWNIPKNFLNIQSDNILGMGSYGRVVSGIVQLDSQLLPVAIQMISDNKLKKNDSKEMLKQLNVLILAGKHENIVSLIGFYENPTTLFIVMEHHDINFKDWLLHSRVLNEERTLFAPFSQEIIVKILLQIAKGMAHLAKQKVVHKSLCCRNVCLDTQTLNAKVTSVGLSKYTTNNLTLDFTRWSAHEIFRQRTPSTKSDVWSFGCLIWEACTLGATPFAEVPTLNIANEIRRGLRLQQIRYISDDIFQIMFNCWQLDSDERPSFQELVQGIELILFEGIPVVNFEVFAGFKYEEYHLELECSS